MVESGETPALQIEKAGFVGEVIVDGVRIRLGPRFNVVLARTLLDEVNNFVWRTYRFGLQGVENMGAGIHPRDMDSYLARRPGQIVCSTMSTAFLDHLALEETVFLVPDGDRVRNLTEEEHARLVKAHAVGIQHVSELLLTQGLW